MKTVSKNAVTNVKLLIITPHKNNIMSFHRKYNSLFKAVDNMIKLYKIAKKEKTKKKDGKK